MPKQTASVDLEFENFCNKLTNEQLGKLVKEYIVESNHSSWEGFTSSDKTGIRRFFSDVILYWGTGEVE